MSAAVASQADAPRRIDWAELRRYPGLVAGFSIITLLVVVALLAPVIAPYPPNALDTKAVLIGVSRAHLFGTDNLGRDIFSRVIHGAQQTILDEIGDSLRTIGYAQAPEVPA